VFVSGKRHVPDSPARAAYIANEPDKGITSGVAPSQVVPEAVAPFGAMNHMLEDSGNNRFGCQV